MKTAYERYKQETKGYAGPAVVEIFGEEPFSPESRPQAIKLSPEQQKMWVEYSNKSNELYAQYIPMPERSFTIISFPTPEIGEDFRGIFEDTVRVNTLDYIQYRRIQECLIESLDQADHVGQSVPVMQYVLLDIISSLLGIREVITAVVRYHTVLESNGQIFILQAVQIYSGYLQHAVGSRQYRGGKDFSHRYVYICHTVLKDRLFLRVLQFPQIH